MTEAIGNAAYVRIKNESSNVVMKGPRPSSITGPAAKAMVRYNQTDIPVDVRNINGVSQEA